MGTFLPSNVDNGVDTSDATATASKILNGYTAYANGVKVTGDAMATASTADASKILNGYKAYNSSGGLITGTAMSAASTADASKILSGYTAYTNAGSLLSGSYVPPVPGKAYDVIVLHYSKGSSSNTVGAAITATGAVTVVTNRNNSLVELQFVSMNASLIRAKQAIGYYALISGGENIVSGSGATGDNIGNLYRPIVVNSQTAAIYVIWAA